MTTVLLENPPPYLLLQSLEDLHRQTMEWQSCIEFWKKELQFFRKLINKYGIKIKLKHNIQDCKHLSQLLSYYSGDLILSLTHLISRHEHKLKFLLSEGKIQDEAAFRKEHAVMEKQLTIVRDEIRAFKTELFALIEKVLAEKNKKIVL